MFKICTKCLVDKPTSAFGKDKNRKDGLHYNCKECRSSLTKEAYQRNPESFAKARDAWVSKNKDAALEMRRNHYQRNRERVYQVSCEWRRQNQDKARSYVAKYRAQKLHATPQWLTAQHLQDIEVEHRLAIWASKVTGIKMHVDHIVPLQGFDVCGLHVPWNLQVIPATENISKGNKYVHKR